MNMFSKSPSLVTIMTWKLFHSPLRSCSREAEDALYIFIYNDNDSNKVANDQIIHACQLLFIPMALSSRTNEEFWHPFHI